MATCRRAGALRAGRARRAIPIGMSSSWRPRSNRSGRTSRRCSRSMRAAFRRSTTATTSARSHTTRVLPTRSISPDSFRRTFARCSAKATGRSAGSHYRAIRRTSQKPIASCASSFPTTARWRDLAGTRIAFQGLPARICWLGLGERHRAGLAFNDMVASGELQAPIVIGRDHLDAGSVASPNRETEAMADGSDAVSDWPLLNALLNTAGGATWVSLHHGGGVGIGYSQHAGMVIVCDGTPEAAKRVGRVLWNDPATGVMRHADAGYDEAIDWAKQQGLNLPSLLRT